MGLGGSYGYAAPKPPPVGVSQPARSIEAEFLSRIAVKHRSSAGTASNKESRAGRQARNEVLNRPASGQRDVLVLDGPSTGGSAGGHNRDQGGKPSGGGKGQGKK
jgi:hypothetical protein